MADDEQFSRTLLLALDAWRYGTRDDQQQRELQRALATAVRHAAERSGLDPGRWERQDAGDGLFTPITDANAEPKVVGPFVRELDEWLGRYNHDRQFPARLRLRVAVHHGVIIPGDLGLAGTAPVHVCRIRDARIVRDVLEAFPDANLVLAVSEPIFDSVEQRHTSLSADDLVRVEVAEPAKRFFTTAWLHVPGVARERLRTHLGALAVGLRFAGPGQPPPGFFDEVAAKSFEAVGTPLPARTTDTGEQIALDVPAGLPGTLLAGTWVEHLREAVATRFPGTRLAVGVALDADPAVARAEAVELAGSDVTCRLLAWAPAGRLVVAVSDPAYQAVVRRGGRLVFPESYRQTETGTGCWIRVPGYSVPPEARPAPGSEQPETVRPGAGAAGSVTTFGNNSPAIGQGTFTAPFIFGDVHGLDGRPR
ncbi:hypothetical protein GCM10027258_44330 [Amycolatopsis stemonae]